MTTVKKELYQMTQSRVFYTIIKWNPEKLTQPMWEPINGRAHLRNQFLLLQVQGSSL